MYIYARSTKSRLHGTFIFIFKEHERTILHKTTTWSHIRLYCIGLLLARYYLFYLWRGQFHQSTACVREGWLLHASSLHNWTNVVKACVNIHCEEATLWSLASWQQFSHINSSRIAVKKLLSGKQNNVKRLQWAKVHKDWTTEQWNKVLLDCRIKVRNLSVKLKGLCAAKSWRKGCNPLYQVVNHQGGSVMEMGSFYQLQSRGFVPGEGQIELRDPIWNATCGSRIRTHAR